MTIVKNTSKVSRLDGNLSPGSSGSISGEADADELRSESSKSASGSGLSEVDSGMGSDECHDSSQPGNELCQVGSQSFSIPLELYDLPDLGSVLSVNTWNCCLSEEERFALAEYLPDLDEENFARTLSELFSGSNFHFRSPISDLFNQLKGGQLEPGVALYHRGLNFFQKREHYRFLRKYHDSMVRDLLRIKDAWENSGGYSVDERLRLLKILRSQRAMYGNVGTEASSGVEGSNEVSWNERLDMARRALHASMPSLDVLSRSSGMTLEPPKGILKVAAPKGSARKEYIGAVGLLPLYVKHIEQKKAKPYISLMALPRKDKVDRFLLETPRISGNRMRDSVGDDSGGDDDEDYVGLPHSFRSSSKLPSYDHYSPDKKKARYLGKDWMHPVKDQAEHRMPKGAQVYWSDGNQPFRQREIHEAAISMEHPVKYDDWDIKSKELKAEEVLNACKVKISSNRSRKSFLEQISETHFRYDPRDKNITAPEVENYSTKAKQKMNDSTHVHYLKLRHSSEKLQPPLLKTCSTERRGMGMVGPDHSLPRLKYMRDRCSGHIEARRDGLDRTSELVDMQMPANISGSIGQYIVSEGATFIEPEKSPTKKPFTLITPSIHTGFSFSIIHLLSAVRKAMVTAHTEDSMNVYTTYHAGEKSLPSLTVQEVIDRVRSNPGDPCILETQEPLQDLVRGVLKIFSSKTSPLGAKGWKALVLYEKSNRSWSWVGPTSSSPFADDTFEEETSYEAWGVPREMLVKLVDAFANWLKNGEVVLKQIGILHAPPIAMFNFDEKERFRDLRSQKNPNTIGPNSNEVRAYFRREEVLRYSVPDRAFSYTAADGKKTVVAPVRGGSGKPTSKIRDHFMLKPDRPPQFTILCLVRDAAARLPGSIGTRADICTLVRDSQYVAEDASDAHVNQVVSGALDRLHYELDPCVQFDGDRKLWVYLHRDREEEDFEDDGTSSTKKWKRPRKGTTEHPKL